ncbi:MAG: DUF1007 family protein [Pseudomonadota bacterium]
MVRVFVSLIAFFGACGAAIAHPHVFIDSQSRLIFGAEKTLSAVAHKWVFDEAFSAFAVQGLDENRDGIYTREELVELAQVNVDSLAEFDFFTFLDLGETPIDFTTPIDYWLDHDGSRLTLNFTLPLADPINLDGRTAQIQVFDPTIFVAFFMDQEKAATIEGAIDGCRSIYEGVEERDIDASTNFTDDFLASLDAVDEFAAQFAEVVKISCT